MVRVPIRGDSFERFTIGDLSRPSTVRLALHKPLYLHRAKLYCSFIAPAPHASAQPVPAHPERGLAFYSRAPLQVVCGWQVCIITDLLFCVPE